MNYRLSIAGIVVAVLATTGAVRAQELSGEQSKQLATIGTEYSKEASQIEDQMQQKLDELGTELSRPGRLETPKAAKESAKHVDAILDDLGDLYGEYIKTKVKFLLEAKNVLTREQKLLLLSQMDPQQVIPLDSNDYMQPNIADLPLNLSIDQRKQLVSLKAELLEKEVELGRDAALTLLDIEKELLSGEASPKKVDPLVMTLADLASKEVHNRVSFFLKAKDVLTLDQRQALLYLLGLN